MSCRIVCNPDSSRTSVTCARSVLTQSGSNLRRSKRTRSGEVCRERSIHVSSLRSASAFVNELWQLYQATGVGQQAYGPRQCRIKVLCALCPLCLASFDGVLAILSCSCEACEACEACDASPVSPSSATWTSPEHPPARPPPLAPEMLAWGSWGKMGSRAWSELNWSEEPEQKQSAKKRKRKTTTVLLLFSSE